MPRTILVTGASGLIGSALARALQARGDRVLRLVRQPPRDDAELQLGDTARLDGLEGVVHLAGENIAKGRWTAAVKARIRDSRVDGTRQLCAALAACPRPPRAFVGASAIGYYGNRGDEVMTEDCAPGRDFLAQVCVDWENASAALAARTRVVRPRIGVVLAPHGGALHAMLRPFRWGLGGRIGSGRQWVSWIALADLVALLCHLLDDEGLHGAINATAPAPVTNAELTRTLGRVLRRPTLAPLPATAVKLLFGEMGEALLLSSTRVAPQRALAAGFAFSYPQLESALRALL